LRGLLGRYAAGKAKTPEVNKGGKAAWDRYQAYKKKGEKKMKDASLFGYV
jgi:hypothetical protein